MSPHSLARALLGALATFLLGCSAPPSAAPAPEQVSESGPALEHDSAAAKSLEPAPAESPALPAQVEDPSTPGGLDLAHWRLTPGNEGLVEIAYRTVSGDEIPRNAMTDLEVRVYRDGRPLSGGRLIVRGWMPDHRHGFVHTPTIEDQGDGVFRVRDLLLHMRGHWQLIFDVVLGNERDNVMFDVQL